MPQFVRTTPAPSVAGGNRGLRPYVRADFCRRCAYCLLDELTASGEENFEMDHFRPKSRFPELHDDFYNLYYACHPCNHIKHDYWPPPDLEARGIGLVDLCAEDFATHFRPIDDGRWDGITESGRYTIEILRLNREHLVKVRRLLSLLGVSLNENTPENKLTQLLANT
jgi:hypothetical protein